MGKLDTINSIESSCVIIGLDSKLARAIAQHESNYNQYAVRFEPKWKYFEYPEKFAQALGITLETERTLQMMSFGPMQVMGSVCRELGYSLCLTELFNLSEGVHMGCLKLQSLCNKYSVLSDVISAYNQGSPLKENGIYKNQNYVDSVLEIYNPL